MLSCGLKGTLPMNACDMRLSKSVLKTGAKYQRLYYAYDSQSRKIIVGYVGDHLENYLSLSSH